MAKLSFIEQFNSTRHAGAPLVWIQTPDIDATVKQISAHPENATCPIVMWDSVRGLTAVNEPAGKNLLMAILRDKSMAGKLRSPFETLVYARENFPPATILFMANLHRFLDPVIIQAIWNLRDAFKIDSRAMVGLSPSVTLPAEISGDVVILNEPLPDEQQLARIAVNTYEAVGQPVPDDAGMAKCTDAVCGLSAFAAEQRFAMSIRESGMDLERLREHRRQAIEQTPGISVWKGEETFGTLGGYSNIKNFLTDVQFGEEPPRVIIFQDEGEKQFGGANGDTSGVTKELLGMQLTHMQDTDADGLLFLGPPGVSKTMAVKAWSNEANTMMLQLNLGLAKASLVGESTRNMNMILKTIDAVSQGRALWFMTCNDISALPPELLSRYTLGTFFFDLPSPSERAAIWQIYFEKWNLKESKDNPRPIDTGWNGRQIRNCCKLSYKLRKPLGEVAKFIVPIGVSQKQTIAERRREADGKYISASMPGPYKAPPEGLEEEREDPTVVAVAVVPGKRKIAMPEGTGKKKVN